MDVRKDWQAHFVFTGPGIFQASFQNRDRGKRSGGAVGFIKRRP